MPSYRWHLKVLIHHGGIVPGKNYSFITLVEPNSPPPKFAAERSEAENLERLAEALAQVDCIRSPSHS